MCVLVLSIYGGYKVVENSETIFRKKKLEWVWKMKKESSNIKWRLSDKILGNEMKEREREREFGRTFHSQVSKSWSLKFRETILSNFMVHSLISSSIYYYHFNCFFLLYSSDKEFIFPNVYLHYFFTPVQGGLLQFTPKIEQEYLIKLLS
jgi:hypothetical protein